LLFLGILHPIPRNTPSYFKLFILHLLVFPRFFSLFIPLAVAPLLSPSALDVHLSRGILMMPTSQQLTPPPLHPVKRLSSFFFPWRISPLQSFCSPSFKPRRGLSRQSTPGGAALTSLRCPPGQFNIQWFQKRHPPPSPICQVALRPDYSVCLFLFFSSPPKPPPDFSFQAILCKFYPFSPFSRPT